MEILKSILKPLELRVQMEKRLHIILKDILEADGKKVIQIGTLESFPNSILDFSLTTPDPVSLFQVLHYAVEKFDYAVLEVSSHALSQIVWILFI